MSYPPMLRFIIALNQIILFGCALVPYPFIRDVVLTLSALVQFKTVLCISHCLYQKSKPGKIFLPGLPEPKHLKPSKLSKTPQNSPKLPKLKKYFSISRRFWRCKTSSIYFSDRCFFDNNFDHHMFDIFGFEKRSSYWLALALHHVVGSTFITNIGHVPYQLCLARPISAQQRASPNFGNQIFDISYCTDIYDDFIGPFIPNNSQCWLDTCNFIPGHVPYLCFMFGATVPPGGNTKHNEKCE